MKRTKAYRETYRVYREEIIPAVGLDRVKEVYRDALFCVTPRDHLRGLADAIRDAEQS